MTVRVVPLRLILLALRFPVVILPASKLRILILVPLIVPAVSVPTSAVIADSVATLIFGAVIASSSIFTVVIASSTKSGVFTFVKLPCTEPTKFECTSE